MAYHASGLSIYNDLAIAIAALRTRQPGPGQMTEGASAKFVPFESGYDLADPADERSSRPAMPPSRCTGWHRCPDLQAGSARTCDRPAAVRTAAGDVWVDHQSEVGQRP